MMQSKKIKKQNNLYPWIYFDTMVLIVVTGKLEMLRHKIYWEYAYLLLYKTVSYCKIYFEFE